MSQLDFESLEPTKLLCNIRAAQESDVDDLLGLHLALQEYHEICNPNIWRMSPECRGQLRNHILQSLYDQDACIFVAQNDKDEIIGMASGIISFSRLRIPSNTASLEDVFVLEEWRRNGIGKELVKRVCQFFASRYIKDVSVRYIVGNEDADKFWTKLGFQPRVMTSGIDLRNLETRISE